MATFLFPTGCQRTTSSAARDAIANWDAFFRGLGDRVVGRRQTGVRDGRGRPLRGGHPARRLLADLRRGPGSPRSRWPRAAPPWPRGPEVQVGLLRDLAPTA